MIQIKKSPGKSFLVKENVPFLYLADTWWYGTTKRCSWPEPFRTLAKDRKSKGFNAIQIVIGVPPEVGIFSEEAKNAGGQPFNKDLSLNEKYFVEVDLKIAYLVSLGFVPVIFGGWGQHIDILGVEKIKELWKEIIDRYSKYSVIFCLCGEVDGFLFGDNSIADKLVNHHVIKIYTKYLPGIIKKIIGKFVINTSEFQNNESEKKLLINRLKKWDEVANFIKSYDKNKKLLTVHVQRQQTADELFSNPKWLNINTIQSGHSKDRAGYLVKSVLESKVKPFINLEPWYEGILGKFTDEDIRYAFWMSMLAGTAGMSYGAQGLWQMNKIGDDFMGHWGSSDWKSALNFKGAKQVGLAKKLLEKLDWQDLRVNLDKIEPKWSEHKTDLPLLSENKKVIVIYFPRNSYRGKFRVKGLNSSKEIKWLDPKTLKGVLTENKINELMVPKVLESKDAICIITK